MYRLKDKYMIGNIYRLRDTMTTDRAICSIKPNTYLTACS